jgi:hypothetical protein
MLVRNGVAFYRCALPTLPADAHGSHAGTWHAILKLRPGSMPAELEESSIAGTTGVAGMPGMAGIGHRGMPYDVLVHSYSNLIFKASLSQESHEPGARIWLSATLREYEVDVGARGRVWAEVSRPDGVLQRVDLPEGKGRYLADFATDVPGLYEVRMRAQGQTSAGEPFVREQATSAIAVPGADTLGKKPRRRPGLLRRWCRCLFG